MRGKTEPYYLKSFEARATRVGVKGIGHNTVRSLVREAVKLGADDDYDQIWCASIKTNFPINREGAG